MWTNAFLEDTIVTRRDAAEIRTDLMTAAARMALAVTVSTALISMNVPRTFTTVAQMQFA